MKQYGYGLVCTENTKKLELGIWANYELVVYSLKKRKLIT